MESKEWLIIDSKIHAVPTLPESFAESFVIGENRLFKDQLFRSSKQNVILSDSPLAAEAINALPVCPKPCAWLVGNTDLLLAIQRLSTYRFEHDQREDDWGSVIGVPIHFMYGWEEPIAVLFPTTEAELVLWKPRENANDALYFTIDALTEKTASELIDQQPDFLKDSKGGTRDRKTVIDELMLKCKVLLIEKPELVITSDQITIISCDAEADPADLVAE